MSLPIDTQILEFQQVDLLESPICGYEWIAKISFDKNFDKAVTGDSFILHKWIIDPSDPDVTQYLSELSSSHPFLQYMSLCRYMSTTLFMGGLSMLEDMKAVHETVDITPIFLAGRDFVLDPVVDTDLIVLYNMQYTYNGTCYWTDYTGSYVPVPRERYDKRFRPCISSRNLRYRGHNESFKYGDTFREISNDLFFLYNKEAELEEYSETIIPSEETMRTFLDLHERFVHTIGV